jgi:DNA-binding IclR family transcriptional regulator
MATSSFGWAHLAVVPQDTRAQLLAQLKQRHGTSWPEVLARIRSAQDMYEKRGYILNSGFYHRDINAVAVPVVPGNGGQIMSLNIGGPAAQVPVKQLERDVAPRLIELAGVLRAALEQGGQRSSAFS